MRLLRVLLALVAFALTGPVTVAEETQAPAAEEQVAVPEAEWQIVITSQIEAFRARDSSGALNFAGQGFKAAFPDPNLFYDSIFSAGYGPILESRSHTFGEFQMLGDTAVMQMVKIVGPDQHLYSALYQLAKEPDGWRVQGVQLSVEQGIGI